MNRVRHYLIVSGLLFSLSANALAQKNPLLITGIVTSVNVDGRYVEPYAIKNNVPQRKETWFKVSVLLLLCNQSETALIVPTPYFPYKRKILFLELPFTESRVVESAVNVDLWGGRDRMPVVLELLDKAEPPAPYQFAIIQPGTCQQVADQIPVKTGFKLEVRPNREKGRLDHEIANAEHAYFKIHYSFSMKDSLAVSDAKQRWSRFGKLLTTADGDFFLETEFIINKLPE